VIFHDSSTRRSLLIEIRVPQENEKPDPKPLITPDEIPEFELEDLGIDESDPNFNEYRRILDRFRASNVSHLS
jgi:splicing factor 3B subunit 2